MHFQWQRYSDQIHRETSLLVLKRVLQRISQIHIEPISEDIDEENQRRNIGPLSKLLKIPNFRIAIIIIGQTFSVLIVSFPIFRKCSSSSICRANLFNIVFVIEFPIHCFHFSTFEAKSGSQI